MNDIAAHVARRRTFAIISHPDAGKTTLTEKLLLFAGAIQIAGTIKARKAARYATSDWMEIEKQRGISVASSVMQFEYRDCVINLLDTPGHQDFSEDTYRVLTAVDAALMVIDAAKGIEPQTLKLLKACRLRDTPVLTFINKLDREVRPPLELLDEIERVLGMSPAPISWPIGCGKDFRGVLDMRTESVRLFEPGASRRSEDVSTLKWHDAAAPGLLGPAYTGALSEADVVRGAGIAFDRTEFLAGRQTPVLFGSAINNFGVQEVLDTLVDFAPSPGARCAGARTVHPWEAPRPHRLHPPVLRSLLARHAARQLPQRQRGAHGHRGIDEAFSGDIIGIPNHGTISLGDTLTEGESLHFGGLPSFAPELFRRVELESPMKAKQLQIGLRQLSEEGAIQIFRLLSGRSALLAAAGALQFDVAVHRLKQEYGVQMRLCPVQYTLARWIASASKAELRRFVEANAHRIAYDAVGSPAYLAAGETELNLTRERWPQIQFHALRDQTRCAEEVMPVRVARRPPFTGSPS